MLPDELSSELEPTIRSCGTVSKFEIQVILLTSVSILSIQLAEGSDDCDTVFQTQKCYLTTAPDVS